MRHLKGNQRNYLGGTPLFLCFLIRGVKMFGTSSLDFFSFDSGLKIRTHDLAPLSYSLYSLPLITHNGSEGTGVEAESLQVVTNGN